MPASWQGTWLEKIRGWLRVQKLERDLRESRKFQKRCEEMRCPNLAALEHCYQETLLHEINEAKQRGQTLSSSTPQTLKVQSIKNL